MPNLPDVNKQSLAGAALLRPRDRGGVHAPYFAQLSAALAGARIARPVIVVDRARLQHNARAVRETLAGKSLGLRLVAKSLPCPELLRELAGPLGCDRYMVFNGPMLDELARLEPTADLLLGKPLPVTAAHEFYARQLALGGRFADPQWLIDTPERLQQYVALARQVQRRLRISFEIDVGLHRGGFSEPAALAASVAAAEPATEICGLMGYDAHVAKLPAVAHAYAASQARYRTLADVLHSRLPGRALTLNGAGSPTYKLHCQGSVANEVSVGSAFLKPVDFDLETLAHHVPAVFIATPVLKSLPSSELPGLERLTGVRRAWDVNTTRAFFIHGGHWLAQPESPPGLQWSDIYGRSINQECLTGSSAVQLRPGDYVFLRPTQSEAVLLQFGPLYAYENGRLLEPWTTFGVSA